MNPHPAMNANVKHAATSFSTRWARAITLGSSGGRPTICAAPSASATSPAPSPPSATTVDPSRRGEGGGVPITRCGAAGPSVPLGLFHVAHDYYYSVPVGLGSRRLAVIHSAMSTRKVRPPSQITRPSVTGPARPSEKPPGLGSTRVWVI